MAKAYHIDSTNRTISEVEYSTLEDMRRFVGGHICLASIDHNTGDTLYVDDEGLLKENNDFFWYRHRLDQPLAGNGLYVGREIDTESGWTTLDPVKTLVELKREVVFL